MSASEPFAAWPELAGLARFLDRQAGRIFFFDSGAIGTGGAYGASGAQGASAHLPIVLVHGLGDEADSFRHLFPLLSAKRRVLALDLPGFGRSVASGRVTVRSSAAALVALLEAETPNGAIVAGSSLGAVVAEAASFRRPDLVKGLVFMDGGLPTPPTGGVDALPMLIPFVGERHYRALRGRPEAAYASLAPYYADLSGLPEADRAFLAARVVDRVESDSQLAAYYSLMRSLAAAIIFRQKRYAKRLASSPTRLLALWGAADRVVPIEGADLLAKTAPRARVHVVEGAGHLPHQEAPAAVAACLEEFAIEIESPT